MRFPPEKLEAAEEVIGYRFEDKTLLERALTHPSAVEGHALRDSYERMEFLGDSLLGCIVALELYEGYPSMNEGALTRTKISLVAGGTLSPVAHQIGLDDCIAFGESELGTGGRGMRSALENVYEALVAAIYLDGGPEPCRSFVERTLMTLAVPEMATRPISPKSQLQEYTQSHRHQSPEYLLVGQEGPAHEPIFTVEVSVGGKVLGQGRGSTKKEAESRAAMAALEALEGEAEGTDGAD